MPPANDCSSSSSSDIGREIRDDSGAVDTTSEDTLHHNHHPSQSRDSKDTNSSYPPSSSSPAAPLQFSTTEVDGTSRSSSVDNNDNPSNDIIIGGGGDSHNIAATTTSTDTKTDPHRSASEESTTTLKRNSLKHSDDEDSEEAIATAAAIASIFDDPNSTTANDVHKDDDDGSSTRHDDNDLGVNTSAGYTRQELHSFLPFQQQEESQQQASQLQQAQQRMRRAQQALEEAQHAHVLQSMQHPHHHQQLVVVPSLLNNNFHQYQQAHHSQLGIGMTAHHQQHQQLGMTAQQQDMDPIFALMSASTAIAKQTANDFHNGLAASGSDEEASAAATAAALAAASGTSNARGNGSNYNSFANHTTNSVPQQQHPTSMMTGMPFAPTLHGEASVPPSINNVSLGLHGAAPKHSSSTSSPDEVLCVRCNFVGSDVRIKGCPRGCAFHARCIDLVGLSNSNAANDGDGGGMGMNKAEGITVQKCPHCSSHASGLEILPLSFFEIDRAQRQNFGRMGNSLDIGADCGFGGSRKRSSSELDNSNTSQFSSAYSNSSSQCYDPSVPRTGRWTDEELAFRDTVISHFLDGDLPLSNGLKLNDFLSNMLKSKQSRLTKKMKHAKLSTKYFRIKGGYISDATKAKQLSELEHAFIHVISDPIERSEVQFHMAREWREHFAERCAYLHIMFDGEGWLKSVDKCDRRVALEKNRSRMVKRRFMMGKAMEKDAHDIIPGVFINQNENRTDDVIFGDGNGGDEDDGELDRFLMSMMEDVTASGGNRSDSSHKPGSTPQVYSKKSSTLRSSSDPNFRYAAPFLAGITSYIERNAVPFEHVDLWVPSFIPPSVEAESPAAPKLGSMGSGANLSAMASAAESNSEGVCRLCFGGSATLGVQVVQDESATAANNTIPQTGVDLEDKKDALKTVPMTGDEIFNLSLFGDYSEKFSFSSGSGLPGRVYKTGVAAWEQFVANAPPALFERRGGAMQFGIKTALGLPIESPNVGRIVLVLYSKHNREKDEELVIRMVKDMRLFHPCPRWKLVVDVNTTGADTPVVSTLSSGMNQLVSAASVQPASNNAASNGSAAIDQTSKGNATAGGGASDKDTQVRNLISLLGENMPSDQSSPLGKQLNNIMSLRLILLRANRTPDEEQLVNTILVLFESYLAAGRARQDIALLVTRDFSFHNEHSAQLSSLMQSQQQQHQHQPMQQQPFAIPSPMLQGQQMLPNFNQPTNLGMMPNSLLRSMTQQHQQSSTPSFLGGQHQLLQNVVHQQMGYGAQVPVFSLINHHHQQQQLQQPNSSTQSPSQNPSNNNQSK